MTHVLVIDDDVALTRALRLGLRASGYSVSVAHDGEEGAGIAMSGQVDIVVLDLGLPDIDGLALYRKIRLWSEIPIIVLSANDNEDRKVEVLNEGADDYVTKPFGMAELEARLRTALRHTHREVAAVPASSETRTLQLGALVLDTERQEMHLDGELVTLTAKEYAVLAYLMRFPSRVCTHQMILAAVWGDSYREESQYLHVYINRLRHKLRSADHVALRTLPGIGYLLEEIVHPTEAK